jgi:phosphonate transport system substrate-binding protein
MKFKYINPVLIFLVVLTSGFSLSLTEPKNNNDIPIKKTYTIGFIRSLFSGVDLSDAQAALKVWVKEIVKTYHYNDGYNLKAKIYNQFDELKNERKQDSLAVIILNTLDYLDFSEKIDLDPALVMSTRGDIFEQYYILVKKTDRYKNVKDLKGANIGLLSAKNYNASKIWLDVTLAKENIPARSRFFNKIITSDKESQLILNLFFGHLDACVVSKGSFLLMKELNPQVGDNLISIQTSPGYLVGLICYIKNSVSEPDKNLFYSNVVHIHELNSGKQLLSLIKIDKLVAFKKEYLNSFKDLMKEYAYLIKTKMIKNEEPD